MSVFACAGHFGLKMYVRECVPAPFVSVDGCTKETTETKTLKDILGLALSFVSGLGDVKVDGTVCTCSRDLCNPDTCDDGSVNFFDTIW